MSSFYTPVRFTRFESCRVFHISWWKRTCTCEIGALFRNIWISLLAKNSSISFLTLNSLALSSCLRSRIGFILLLNLYRCVFCLMSIFINLLHSGSCQVLELRLIHSIEIRSDGDLHATIIWEQRFQNSSRFRSTTIVIEVWIWRIHLLLIGCVNLHSFVDVKLICIMTLVHFGTIITHIIHLFGLSILI